MSGDSGEELPPPEWEYLIAHHFPDRYGRTLTARIGRRSYHFCARCTGQLVGFAAVLAALLAVPAVWLLGSTPLAGLVLGLCPSFALVDWLAQTTNSRESSNRLRVISGGLLGAAFGGLVAFGLKGSWLLFGLGFLVLGGYLVVALVVLQRTGAWRRVIAEHFP
jgi:uncharacterized membrane protein